ncbi:MAG: Eco57I restriction-modification methylase domain-containing protein [Promethearchaeota archaeon]
MIDFIQFLKKREVIATLIEYYDLKDKKSILLLNKIIEDLVELNNIDDEYDIIGNLYEKRKNQAERKELGEFYTPKLIVNYILDSIGYKFENNIDELKIIDISCGSGSFLVEAVKRIKLRWKNKFKIRNFSELSIANAIKIIENIQNNIFGMDVNPIAVILCQINFYLALSEIINQIMQQIEGYNLPIFNISDISALKIIPSGDFDFVVGNPPYLFMRDIPISQREAIESLQLETNTGQYDYYQIFMELGTKHLKNHGFLGYIVPDSFLTLSNRRIIRKYIYNNTKIKELFHIGEKFDEPIVSNIIIILQKENNNIEREMNYISINDTGNENKKPKTIIQKYIRNWNYDYLIHLDDEDLNLLTHLTEDFLKLGDIMNLDGYQIELSRGVELGKEGKVIYCKKCDKFLPLPRNELKCSRCNTILDLNSMEKIIHKSLKKVNQNYKPFIYSIDQYIVKEYRYIDITKNGINYKDFNLYKDRIIIRQISKNNRICATYCKSLSLTSQSFYNMKIIQSPISEFNNYYLLGLINSNLLTYFFIKSFGSYKKLFPRILIEKIKEFPIKIPKNKEDIKYSFKIIEKVKFLLNSKERDKALKIEKQKEIDDLVFQLYQIPNHLSKKICNYIQD